MKNVALLLVVLLTSCASASGVVSMGNDRYFVSRQGATSFTGMASLRAEALQEAYAKCNVTGDAVEVLETTESQPPYLLGNYPRVDITFRCVNQEEKR